MNLKNSENASNGGGFADEVPTVQQKVIVPLREYERLKRIVREGENKRIQSRNRLLAVFATILVFLGASTYVIFW